MSDSSGLLLVVLAFVGFCVLFLGVLGVIVYVIVRSGKATNLAWGELGKRTGLTFKPAATFTSPELNGNFRGRATRVYTYSSGNGQNRQTYTAVAMTVKNAGGSAFEVSPTGSIGNLLGRMVAAQDVEIGNPEFDKRFVIKSAPPEYARTVLGSVAAQTSILALPDSFRIELKGATLEHSKRGLEENADLLMTVIDTLSNLAEVVER